MRHVVKAIVLLTIAMGTAVSKADDMVMPYRDARLKIDQRVADLLSRMTVEEKAGQLVCKMGWGMFTKHGESVEVSEEFKKLVSEGRAGGLWGLQRADPWTKKTLSNGLSPHQAAEAANAIQKYAIEHSRLGIPLLLSEECPHGHMAIGATVFPTAIGQASTWDPELIERMGRAIGTETRACGGQIGYGPVLDLAREPRWSRVEETYGEDPFLVGSIGVALVRGFQGEKISDPDAILSTLKHFAAHGIPEGGHNAGMANIGPRELHTALLPPFKAAIDAGAGSVMSSYNEIDGIPCTSDEALLTDLLRNEWKFKGFVVSDLMAIQGLQTSQHVAATLSDAAAMAINAGVDQDLGGEAFTDPLLEAIKRGQVSMASLDRAAGRVLKAKFELGLFEKCEVDPAKSKIVNSDAHRKLARQVARESIVLLKNTGNVLPLKKEVPSIAVIGPNADSVYNQLGDYTAPQPEGKVLTVLEGVRRAVSAGTIVRYERGCGIRDRSDAGFATAIEAARQSSVVVVVLGGSSARDFDTLFEGTGAAKPSMKASGNEMEAGEGFDRASLQMAGVQEKLLQKIAELGKPTLLVMIAGRPLNLNWAAEHVPAILMAWYPGEQGGGAIADVLFGDYNPAGRLPISIPRSVGQLPVYYNHKPGTRREYVDESASPLYSFGHGLSYTKFEYRNPTAKLADKGGVEITVEVTNTGAQDGEEVVQCYLNHEASSVTMPETALKAFRRAHLIPGQSETMHFTLHSAELAVFDRKGKWVVEPGQYRVRIGGSSDRLPVEATFQIVAEVSLP